MRKLAIEHTNRKAQPAKDTFQHMDQAYVQREKQDL